MGHELHLVADIRVASADVRFGQDENTHWRSLAAARPSAFRATPVYHGT
jgi:hypothetical protein